MCYQRAGALPFPKYGNVLSEDRFQCVRDQNIVCGTGITYGYVTYGPGSVVGIATSYGLDGPGIEFRWRSWFEALCYKLEGRGFFSRWCHWNFSST